MKTKCFICGWEEGYCQAHHIIPLREDGKDCEKNIVHLCPNHHSECTKIGEQKFKEKYNLPNGEKDNKELLNKIAIKYLTVLLDWNQDNPNRHLMIKQNKEYFKDILKICKENNWDEYDMIAQVMGITRRRLINTQGL